jgi:hypothetical protein
MKTFVVYLLTIICTALAYAQWTLIRQLRLAAWTIVIVISMLCKMAQAWQVQFPPEPDLGYYNLAAGTNDEGRTVFATTEGMSTNIILFQIDAQGDIIWSLADGVRYSEPSFEKVPLQVKPLPDNGWAVLVEETHILMPDACDRLVWLAFDSTGILRRTATVCDTTCDCWLRSADMVIGRNIALVSWLDCEDARIQRIRLADGSIQDGPYGSPLNMFWLPRLAVANDSFLVTTGDSLLVLDSDGMRRSACTAPSLSGVNLLVHGNARFVYGFQNSEQSLLLERFAASGLEEIDTVSCCGPMSAGGMAQCQDTLYVTYSSNHTAYLQRCFPDNQHIADTLVSTPATIWGPYMCGLDSGTVVTTWSVGGNVTVQQYRSGRLRWPSGLNVGSMDMMGVWELPFALTGNGQVAVVSWINNHMLCAQPPDSDVGAAVSSHQFAASGESLEAFPNPTNAAVRIRFRMAKPQRVTLEVHNVLGQKVAQILSDAPMQVGNCDVTWIPQETSGVYVITLRSSEAVLGRQKIVYLR